MLITGAGGFVGQHLIRELLQGDGTGILGCTLDGSPPAPGTLTGDEIRRVTWQVLDITSPASVADVVERSEPHQVYHLAGQSSVGESFADPAATWSVNATGTLHLLHALEGRGSRVLVISSAEVYGDVGSDEVVNESTPLAPLTPYGASKAAAEILARQAAAAGNVETVIARSFNHTGPGQDERFIFPSMARQLARIRAGRGKPELRVGNLSARRDFLDVRDVARAYVRLMKSGESGAVYNVCSGQDHSLQQLVDELVAISGTGAEIVVDPERFRPADIPVLRGDPARIAELGWVPEIPLRQTLEDLYAQASVSA